METDDSLFNDSDQRRLDKAINEEIDGLQSMGVAPNIVDVLELVVETAAGLLKNEYSNRKLAVELLRANNELSGMLREALRKKEYSTIRNLKILHKDKQNKSSQGNIEIQMTATANAWRVPFAGDGHKLLEATVHSMNKKRAQDAYANFLPIIQSSGTGKSRTVDQLARHIFTIPFNLRAAEPNAFPPADSAMLALFMNFVSGESYLDVRNRYCRLFAMLFGVVLANVPKPERNTKFKDTQALATMWHQHLETEREKIYKSFEIQFSAAKDDGSGGSENVLTEAANSLIAALDGLVEKKPNNGDVRILLYFDEAHSLTNSLIEGDESKRNRYDALCSALDLMKAVPVFAITMSTNSNLAKLSPSSAVHPSLRVVDEDTLQTPFTELPFDILFDGQPIINPSMTLNDVSNIKVMAKFGRPLFATRSKFLEDVIKLARVKLTMKNKDDPRTDQSTLAVLANRLLLTFDGFKESARLIEAKLVEGNMRIAYSVPKERNFMHSGYPSEPILAEAAALEMDALREGSSIPRLLGEHVATLNKGDRGELVMRVLLTEAYDAAAKARCERDGVDLSFSRPVPLFDFLEKLFGEENFGSVMTSRAMNAPNGVDFEEAFRGSYVRFTHFGAFGSGRQTTTNAACAAISRGMAIQCRHTQNEIDAIIPIAMNADQPLSEDMMTGILIQVKNRDKASAVKLHEGTVNFFPNTTQNARPYIALVMELSSRSGTSLKSGHSERHPCYRITVSGYSDDQYGVVRDEKDYHFLLQDGGLFPDHCRQGPEWLSAVRRLKPIFEDGPDSYHWHHDDFLKEKAKEKQTKDLKGLRGRQVAIPQDKLICTLGLVRYLETFWNFLEKVSKPTWAGGVNVGTSVFAGSPTILTFLTPSCGSCIVQQRLSPTDRRRL